MDVGKEEGAVRTLSILLPYMFFVGATFGQDEIGRPTSDHELSGYGLTLEEMLGEERINPAVWDRFEELSGKSPEPEKSEASGSGVPALDPPAIPRAELSVFLRGAFSRNYLPEFAFFDLIEGVGLERITRVNYPTGFEARLSEHDVRDLLVNPDVLYVDVSLVFRTVLDDVVEIIDAVGVWDLKIAGTSLSGLGQTVAVVDTGIEWSHTDLAPKNILGNNLNCYGGGGCFEDSRITDLHGHGTKMAGIIAANGGKMGVAHGADLIGLKIFPGSDGEGRILQELTQAVVWCVEHSEEYDITVINMSVASDELYPDPCPSGALKNAIDLAVSKRIAIAAGTGNDGSTTAIGLPACIPNVIPVAAATKNDLAWSGSNYNDLVKLFATGGENIFSTCINGSYCQTGGTSAATAATSGSLALIQHFLSLVGQPLSLHPLAMEDLLFQTGDPVLDLRNEWVRINIGSAIESFTSSFTRGDANMDQIVDVSDPISVFDHLFGTLVTVQCEDAADADDNGRVDIADVLFLLEYIFGIGPALPEPSGLPGQDQTRDELSCFRF